MSSQDHLACAALPARPSNWTRCAGWIPARSPMRSRRPGCGCATRVTWTATVRCLFPDLRAVGGLCAADARPHQQSAGARACATSITRLGDQLLALPAPRILVVEDVESGPGTGSFMGEVHANIYRALGCAGIVTNGAVRDLPALRRLELSGLRVARVRLACLCACGRGRAAR